MLSTLKDLGFGKATMEELVKGELEAFLQVLGREAEKGPIQAEVSKTWKNLRRNARSLLRRACSTFWC